MELYTTIIIYRILRDFNADDITDIPSFTLFLFENDKVRGEFYKKKKKVPLLAISHKVLVVFQRLCKSGFPVINQKVISAAVYYRGLRVRVSNFEGEYFHVGKVGLPKNWIVYR